MKSLYYRILKDCLPEAFETASEFLKSYTEIELLQIRNQLVQFLAAKSTVARYRKFIVTYLAIHLCLEVPALLDQAIRTNFSISAGLIRKRPSPEVHKSEVEILGKR